MEKQKRGTTRKKTANVVVEDFKKVATNENKYINSLNVSEDTILHRKF